MTAMTRRKALISGAATLAAAGLGAAAHVDLGLHYAALSHLPGGGLHLFR